METFAGKSFHTSRWDYTVDLEGKRVGIIGTGATAVQVIPEIAKVVKHLTVFQRTPSTIDVRDQRATTPQEIETWSKEPGWARARRDRLAMISSGRTAPRSSSVPSVPVRVMVRSARRNAPLARSIAMGVGSTGDVSVMGER
jgi:cation diffusion facilitator CzcD-associated flavoprotein CzcO